MEEATFDAHLGRHVAIDICHACQSFWFDTHESATLSPGSTLKLFRIIGAKITRPDRSNADLAKCPRCKSRLRRTHDLQRTTKFEYLSCPHAHGRLTTFFDFLREKDFIRPLTPHQIEELRRNVQSVNCANCGAPVDLTSGSACTHCGSPLSMLDLKQMAQTIDHLQTAASAGQAPADATQADAPQREPVNIDALMLALKAEGRASSVPNLIETGLSLLGDLLRKRL